MIKHWNWTDYTNTLFKHKSEFLCLKLIFILTSALEWIAWEPIVVASLYTDSVLISRDLDNVILYALEYRILIITDSDAKNYVVNQAQ